MNREILRLALPSILANITVPLVGMVDIAVAGHLDGLESGAGAAAFIAAIALGSTLFDLLYWNFAFLRSGTGGLTAQAYGQGNLGECARVLKRALVISAASALLLLAIQWFFVKGAFLLIDCSPEVGRLACRYFFIRIWAAPATLSLMAFKGWFIGMQDSVAPMSCDLVVNGGNIAGSIILSRLIGFEGIACGTVLAQYCGLLCACAFLLLRYRKVLSADRGGSLRTLFRDSSTRRFFSMNADLVVRSFCFIGIYIGYTFIAARYGDVALAASSILMKLLLLFSYFTDGFAYAGEAMSGKYIGAGDKASLRRTVRLVFAWSMAIAVLFIGIYGCFDELLLKLMTDDASVVEACHRYLPWLLLMPPIGCAAFTWDGIYLGATASASMRNAMLVSAAAFFAVWMLGIRLADEKAAIHILMAAYFAHLVARTIYLSVAWKGVRDKSLR